MKQRIILVLMAALMPTVVTAQEPDKYQCTYGDMQRRVEMVTEPGVDVPCSVLYFKDTEAPGEQQVLWSADNDASYCRTKMMEFVAKLEGWGWNCGRDVEDEAVPDEPEELLGTSE